MAQQKYLCGKCGKEMKRGFIVNYDDGAYFAAKWIEGEPVNRSFMGITGHNVETHGRANYVVRSLRCEGCGFLELYGV